MSEEFERFEDEEKASIEINGMLGSLLVNLDEELMYKVMRALLSTMGLCDCPDLTFTEEMLVMSLSSVEVLDSMLH